MCTLRLTTRVGDMGVIDFRLTWVGKLGKLDFFEHVNTTKTVNPLNLTPIIPISFDSYFWTYLLSEIIKYFPTRRSLQSKERQYFHGIYVFLNGVVD